VETASTRPPVGDPALAWSQGLKVEAGGSGTVAAAGVVLPRLLADRLGLTTGLARVVARAGFFPIGIGIGRWWTRRCALAAGASCLSDIEAMTAQEEIFGPGGGASDSNAAAGVGRAGPAPGRRRAARAAAGAGHPGARAAAWAAIVAGTDSCPRWRSPGGT
jgi:hypothetical protein